MVRARSKATFSRGHPRFGATQKGGVNGAVLIAFVKRSIAGGKREIFSIADPPETLEKPGRSLKA
ncbi:MAG: hypothetical protein WBE80_08575 [Methylocella sp.]